MRTQEIEYYLEQTLRLRTKLCDPVNPTDKIERPRGMRRKLFSNRVERLARHEQAIADKLLGGFRRFGG